MEPSLSDLSERAWEDLAQNPIINVLEHHLGLERRDMEDRIFRAIIFRKLRQFKLGRDLCFYYSTDEG